MLKLIQLSTRRRGRAKTVSIHLGSSLNEFTGCVPPSNKLRVGARGPLFGKQGWESVLDAGVEVAGRLPFHLLSGSEFSTYVSWPVRLQV